MDILLAFILLILPAILIFGDLVYYLYCGRCYLNSILFAFFEIVYVIFLPLLFLSISSPVNDCCSDSAFFSPEHLLTIYIVIALCIVAYFYSSWRRVVAAGPLIELGVNCLLITGIVLNVFIAYQHSKSDDLSLVNIIIIVLYSKALIRNQRLLLCGNELVGEDFKPGFQKFAWKILNLNIFLKFPILIILCCPILSLLTVLLMLLGQKPDSAVRAFTDTYKHGFSQLDEQCLNAICPGGHFLCTIAAKGHTGLVKPIRLGRRAGNIIVCNRQLLVSNAFEDLLQQKFPFIHKPIRNIYNKVGGFIHCYYGAFNHKLVSDSIYILMKPLEWFFLTVLYLYDKNPENRIAKQYGEKGETMSQVEESINLQILSNSIGRYDDKI
ncbi:MAG: hypothetical protein H7Y13_17430 [Sphingobacteriaceae bacterium]|nr:hypothetical protein [Sphingobacteriaceae bacterium]